MSDAELESLLAWLDARQKARPAGTTLQENRRLMDEDAASLPLPEAVRYEPCRLAGIPCEWAIPDTARTDCIILYLHGGAFCIGSLVTHRRLVGHIAKACRMQAVAVDYRLAPEHPFPTALDDALAAYQALLGRGQRIVVMGDSAGGGLAASLMLRLRDEGLPQAAAAVLLSPWLDLTASGDSYRCNADRDPFMKRADALFVARGYLKKADPRHPYASALFGDLHGLPPVLLQVGSIETLLDDSTRFAQRAEQAGVAVQLSVWNGMIHVWHSFYEQLSKAREAITEIGRFVDFALPAPNQPPPPA